MRNVHRLNFRLWCCLTMALACAAFAMSAQAANGDAERQAKTAVPQVGEALIYVYRASDARTAPFSTSVDGGEAVPLTPRTFAWWRVKPGRHALRVDGAAASLALQCEGGRVYYLELVRSASGAPLLRPVSFATGRAQVQESRLAGSVAVPARERASTRTPPAESASRGAFMFKLGAFKLADNTQTILGATQQFDSSASSVFGLEGEWFFRPDISLGGEYLQYSNSFSTAGTGLAGEVDTSVFIANIKRYFPLSEQWRPYLGAGAGLASTKFSGSAITGNTSGLALQVVAGLQWRRGAFALRGEYRYLKAKTEDDNSNKVDMSGSGAFLAAGFYF